MYKSEIEKLTVPTELGQITILPHHIPLVATLVPGEMIVYAEGKSMHYALAGGFIEVRPEDRIVILADAAEHVEEIDEKRAAEAQERAKKIMESVNSEAMEYAEASAALERSLARMRVARRRHHGRGMASGSLQE